MSDYGVKRSYDAVVMHSMEGWLAGALARWNTGAAGADLCITRAGLIYLVRGQLSAGHLAVPFGVVMWSAGTDNKPQGGTYGRTEFWKHTNINPHALNVELEGFAQAGFTSLQVAALGRLRRGLAAWYPKLTWERTYDQIAGVHAHSDLSANRSDPGPHFDFAWVCSG